MCRSHALTLFVYLASLVQAPIPYQITLFRCVWPWAQRVARRAASNSVYPDVKGGGACTRPLFCNAHCVPAVCVSVSLQLVKLIEDTANKMDSSPVELETQKLAFGREDENKYPLLAGMAIVNIRLRAAIFQVCVSMPGSAAARVRPPRVLYCSCIHLPMHGDTKVPSSSVFSIPGLHVFMLIKATVHKTPRPN